MLNYMNLPVKSFAVCSEDEDVLVADDPASFEQADELLNKMREENPDQVWNLIAEIDA